MNKKEYQELKTGILQPPFNFNQINIEVINSPHVIFT